MLSNLSDDVKKIFLAGVGAVAVTAEKSKEVINDLVKKGELTIEQGKVLNEELKRNIKKTVREHVSHDFDKEVILDKIQTMDQEQLDEIKAKLAEMECAKKDETDGEKEGKTL